ncbi:MAG: protein kinase [Candidatus Peregrinibacteria bacterium]|nr:protein kinase [Candidatus Peregrinibacteria bacterium]
MIFEPSFGREVVHIDGKKYDLQGTLGKNSHAQVYLAETENGEQIVIKRFKRNHEGGNMFQKTLESQRHMLANADVISAAGLPRTHFVRDFVQVADFHDGVDINQASGLVRISISQIRDLIKAAATNIETLAKANLVHRDIKPENIILTQAGEFTPQTVKIIDTELLTTTDHTEDTYSIGTPLFIPPESMPMRTARLFTGDPSVDTRADIIGRYHTTSDFYSLGFVAYELLPDALHRVVSPLDASENYDLQDLFYAKVHDRFFYPDAMQRMEQHYIPKVQPLNRPGARAVLGTILAMTQADPEKRPQSAQEISDMLEEKGGILNYYARSLEA